MKRPILIFTLALFHGEIIAENMSVAELKFFFLFIMLLVIFYFIFFDKRRFVMFIYLLGAVLGFCIMNNTKTEQKLIDDYDKNNITIEGEVLEITQYDYGYYIILDVKDSILKFRFLCKINYKEPPDLKEGNIVVITGNLKKFSTNSNPGSFNEKNYYYSKGIICQINETNTKKLDNNINEFKIFTKSIRNTLSEALVDISPEKEGGILNAMIFGEKSNLDSKIKELYSDGGIIHILAISGLHISIIGMGVFRLIGKVVSKKRAIIISIIVMILYGIMTGGSVSAIRAIVMFIINLLSKVSGRIYDMKNSICIAVIYLCLLNPYVIFNSSFQMSFSSVIAIAFVYPYIIKYYKIKNKFLKSVIISLTITLINAPFVVNAYYELAAYSVLINIIILPFMSLVVISGLISSIIAIWWVEPAKIILSGSIYILKFYEFICELSTKLPFAKIVTGHFNVTDFTIYFGIIIIFLYVINNFIKKELVPMEVGEIRRKRYIRCIPCFGLVFVLSFYLYYTDIEKNIITFLDVGQGEAAFFVSKEGTTYLFDGGSSSASNIGKSRILPYLKYNGVKTIDYVVLSHSDDDHTNGIIDIMSCISIKVNNLVLPYGDDGFNNIIDEAVENNINIVWVDESEKIVDGDTIIDFVNPLTKKQKVQDNNENSLVSIITNNDKKIALLGDIGIDTENIILKHGLWEKVDVLKVAHHGSKYSSSESALSVLNPDISIISCSKNNLFGHPHIETLERIKNVCENIFITYETGAVSIKLDNSKGLIYDYYYGKQS